MAMMLGDLLAAARRSSVGFPALVAGTELAESVTSAAAQEEISPVDWVRQAAANFERFASEEDWAMLISRMRGSADDPGSACLQTMVKWQLAQAGPAAAEEAPR